MGSTLTFGAQKLRFPSNSSPRAACVLDQYLSEFRRGCFTSPITLPFAHHSQPRNRNNTGLNHASNSHVVSFDRHAAGGIGHDVHIVALALCLDGRHRETDLSPQRGQHQFLSACVLYRFDDAAILPRVDKCAVDRFLLRENIPQSLYQVAPALLHDRGQYCRNAKHFGALSQTDDVVHDHRGFVTVQVGELKRLMVDENKNAVLGREQCIEASSCGGHGASFSLRWLWERGALRADRDRERRAET